MIKGGEKNEKVIRITMDYYDPFNGGLWKRSYKGLSQSDDRTNRNWSNRGADSFTTALIM